MTFSAYSKTFLFSVDFEDVHRMITGLPDRDSVRRSTEAYLTLLEKYKMKCTFFMVGIDALEHRELVRKILERGHEIACHSHMHIPLSKMSPETFEDDLMRNIDALKVAGAENIRGYRAPILSLTADCEWVYDILERHGIHYSSSVLPAKNPLYGWPNFGSCPKRMKNIVEIPVTLSTIWPVFWPFASGTYFRMFPFWITKILFNRASLAGTPVVGYFHPYDVDTSESFREYPELRGRYLLSRLMFYRRGSVLKRLEALFASGYRSYSYAEYLKNINLN